MNELERLGLLVSAVEMLNQAGSWTGRTHIQKFMYFAQEMLGVSSEYEFILYQRGPYSFDLDDDIRTLRSVGAVDIAAAPPYGPTYHPTQFGKALEEKGSVSQETRQRLKELSKILGKGKTARDLELLATTFFVMEEGHKSDDEIVTRVLALKPHFGRPQVEPALSEIRQIGEKFA